MKNIDRQLYISGIMHMDYFLWHVSKLNNIGLMFYYYVALIFAFFFFPITSFIIPDWNSIFDVKGSLYPLPIALYKNKPLSKKMQSKLFWYICFTQNNIQTPTVYFYIVNNKIKHINDYDYDNSKTNEYLIIKPNYGTQGKSIKKITIDHLKTNYYSDSLVQEYIQDCFSENARHFRINTIILNNESSVFSIDERKQPDKNKIASNHANGGKITFCKNNICNFLSTVEQSYISDICNKLNKLHFNEFSNAPLIGWDVCLTCKGPYVFEGNLGADIEKYNYEEYMKFMEKMYSDSFK
jgi:hypothetical protein